jgi:hypothetical protein
MNRTIAPRSVELRSPPGPYPGGPAIRAVRQGPALPDLASTGAARKGRSA